jgi:hypothetical protein
MKCGWLVGVVALFPLTREWPEACTEAGDGRFRRTQAIDVVHEGEVNRERGFVYGYGD